MSENLLQQSFEGIGRVNQQELEMRIVIRQDKSIHDFLTLQIFMFIINYFNVYVLDIDNFNKHITKMILLVNLKS